jgi:hypothetical protein
MTDEEKAFYEAGARWDGFVHRICVGDATEKTLLRAINAAATLLVCYAKRDRERLDYPRERYRHWVAHVASAVLIAALLAELVSQ